MIKFYKIPMRTNFASTENGKLIDILKEKYPELYKREMETIKLQYVDEPLPKDVLNRYYQETSLMYMERGVPEYIIAAAEEDKMYEYWTRTPLNISKVILNKHEIEEEAAYYYILDNADYMDVASDLFPKSNKPSILKKPIEFVKKIIPCKRDN